MWFRMPQGVAGISVELQNFASEINFEGRDYFRAPDHFSPRILALKGFEMIDKAPEGFPEDIPRSDPLRDGAIAELTKAAEMYKAEVSGLRSDLNSTVAKVAALVNERNDYKAKLEAAETKIITLEEQIEDLEEAKPLAPTAEKD